MLPKRIDFLACIHYAENWYKLSKSVKLLGVSQNNEYIKDSSFIPPELSDLPGLSIHNNTVNSLIEDCFE